MNDKTSALRRALNAILKLLTPFCFIRKVEYGIVAPDAKIKKGNIKSKNLSPTQLACFICVANPSSPPTELWRASSPTIAAPPISQNMLKPRIMSSESTRALGFILANLPEFIQQIARCHCRLDIYLALALFPSTY
jgi:hypothetical protein